MWSFGDSSSTGTDSSLSVPRISSSPYSSSLRSRTASVTASNSSIFFLLNPFSNPNSLCFSRSDVSSVPTTVARLSFFFRLSYDRSDSLVPLYCALNTALSAPNLSKTEMDSFLLISDSSSDLINNFLAVAEAMFPYHAYEPFNVVQRD
ncbi:JM62 [macacine gammaherpesvirus 11]|uniref:JM62 n=2 Tax=macacine gammaherpesvirus 11 TaxID=2560570 RepID=G9JMP0_9GAMA|nr:JM62 [Macaca fuscata rhadinovirus]AAT00039.1 JM62 [Macaca fuscata rhadinovirus]AEW87587.1 JM62 [Macaca fuscata rhadinovirus]AEW87757.1 JM62 [Macaca fuscata rhadinovirus]